jgi:cell division protein FtsN
METNQPSERKKKPFVWIILVVAVLLAGALVLSRHLRTHSSQVSVPVVARGKIPPPPPSPSVDSAGESSGTAEVAPSAEAGSPEDTTGTVSRGDTEASPVTAVDAEAQKSAPEMKSETTASPKELDAVGTRHEPADNMEQTGASGSSDDQASAPAPGDVLQEKTAAAELQAATHETPSGPPSSDASAPPPSELPAAGPEPAPASPQSDVSEAATPYAIQVGAYRSKNNAERQVAQMQEKGFETYIYEKNDKDQKAWYFVRFGRFGSFNAAKQALNDLKEQQRMDGAIVRSKSN